MSTQTPSEVSRPAEEARASTLDKGSGAVGIEAVRAQAPAEVPAIACSPGVRWWQRRPAPPFPPPTGCRRVRLPFYGFVVDADDDHRARVDRFFHVPMLVLSLLVLPILVAQYHFSSRLNHPWIPIALETGFLLISVAFLFEFAVKVTVARSRLRYMLANWLDMVIILLPFLRPFRSVRVLRLAYGFRGVSGKLIRTAPAAAMSLGMVQRLCSRFVPPQASGEAPPDYSKWSKASLIAEIHRLEEQLREFRRKR